MNTEGAHAFVDQLAKLLELAGVGIIIGGVVLAAVLFIRAGFRGCGWQVAYQAVDQTSVAASCSGSNCWLERTSSRRSLHRLRCKASPCSAALSSFGPFSASRSRQRLKGAGHGGAPTGTVGVLLRLTRCSQRSRDVGSTSLPSELKAWGRNPARVVAQAKISGTLDNRSWRSSIST